MSDTIIHQITPRTLPRMCWFLRAAARVPDWEPGMLYAFGTDYDEHDGRYGMFPVGTIEDMSGQMHSIYVDRISLAHKRPGEDGAE